MIEIKEFGICQFSGTEQELLEEKEFINLKKIYDYINCHGKCHVRIKGGDYDGSIALFTADDDKFDRGVYVRMMSREERYNLHYHWFGKLSWKGKRNNPKFTLMDSTCDVLLDYEGDTVLKRFNLKEESKKLLNEAKLEDIDGNILSKGDKVLYMNLRYGSGGSLCHGTIKDFKAHARDGYVSVIIREDNSGEESNCNYPSSQVYKKG